MDVVAKTDIGCIRSENQDRILHQSLKDNAALAVVCDGMGGENSGSVASELAINTFADKINAGYRSEMDDNSVRNLMISAISATNTIVNEMAGTDETMHGMGTTCVAVIARDTHAYIINVGDSRAYCINPDEITQITKDHTMVQMLVEQGKIAEDEVRSHPQRNLITRAVGAEPLVTPDYYEYDLGERDCLMLCSDGLFGFCDEQDMLSIVRDNAPAVSVEKLVELAKSRGGGDNISVILVTR